jgi:hypothetical protein
VLDVLYEKYCIRSVVLDMLCQTSSSSELDGLGGPGGCVLRGPRTVQEAPKGDLEAPGRTGKLEWPLGGKIVNFCCYLLHLSDTDKKAHGIRNGFEHLNDFALIFARVNLKNGHSTREWRRHHARSHGLAARAG